MCDLGWRGADCSLEDEIDYAITPMLPPLPTQSAHNASITTESTQMRKIDTPYGEYLNVDGCSERCEGMNGLRRARAFKTDNGSLVCFRDEEEQIFDVSDGVHPCGRSQGRVYMLCVFGCLLQVLDETMA